MSIYENVKRICREKDISIFELEKTLNFPRSSIYKWQKHCPSVDKLKILADYFGVSIEYFLEESERDAS